MYGATAPRRGFGRVLLAALGAGQMAASAGAPPVVVLRSGDEKKLSEASALHLAQQVRALMMSCNFNSLSYPEYFPAPSPGERWEQTLRRPHLYVRFQAPFVISEQAPGNRLDNLEAAEVLVALEKDLEPWLTRHDATVVQHTKCAGILAWRLKCSTPIRPLLGKAELADCAVLDRESD